jgi:serine/threonine protein phosphatase PrpC
MFSKEDFAMVGLIEKFETDKAVNVLKEWIENPLKEGTYEKIKIALWSLETDFDDNMTTEVLGREEY